MLYLIAHFFAACFLVNSIPHLVKGVSGQPFQSPFAKPPGVGLSSPAANVFWGGLNAIIGIVLLLKVGPFSAADNTDLAVTLAGGWIAAFGLAKYFGGLYSDKNAA